MADRNLVLEVLNTLVRDKNQQNEGALNRGLELTRIQVQREEADKQRKFTTLRDNINYLRQLHDKRQEVSAQFGSFVNQQKKMAGGEVQTDASKIIGRELNNLSYTASNIDDEIKNVETLIESESANLSELYGAQGEFNYAKSRLAPMVYDMFKSANPTGKLVQDATVDSMELSKAKQYLTKELGREPTQAEMAGLSQGLIEYASLQIPSLIEQEKLRLQNFQLMLRNKELSSDAESKWWNNYAKEFQTAYAQTSSLYSSIRQKLNKDGILDQRWADVELPKTLTSDTDFEKALDGLSSIASQWLLGLENESNMPDSLVKLLDDYRTLLISGTPEQEVDKANDIMRWMLDPGNSTIWAGLEMDDTSTLAKVASFGIAGMNSDEKTALKGQLKRLVSGYDSLAAYQSALTSRKLSMELQGIQNVDADGNAKKSPTGKGKELPPKPTSQVEMYDADYGNGKTSAKTAIQQLIDIKSSNGFDPFNLKKAAKLRELNAQLAKERGDTLGIIGNTIKKFNDFSAKVGKTIDTQQELNIDLESFFKGR